MIGANKNGSVIDELIQKLCYFNRNINISSMIMKMIIKNFEFLTLLYIKLMYFHQIKKKDIDSNWILSASFSIPKHA